MHKAPIHALDLLHIHPLNDNKSQLTSKSKAKHEQKKKKKANN